MNFNSHTDAVLAVAVALVNALTPGCAHGRPYQPPAGDQRATVTRDALNADGLGRGAGQALGKLPLDSPSALWYTPGLGRACPHRRSGA